MAEYYGILRNPVCGASDREAQMESARTGGRLGGRAGLRQTVGQVLSAGSWKRKLL